MDEEHLRVEHFTALGQRDDDADMDRVSVYVLVAIVKNRLGLEASLYTLLQVFSVTLFEKMPMTQAFSESTTTFKTANSANQLESVRLLTGQWWHGYEHGRVP